MSTTPPVFVPEVLSSFALINPFPQVASFSEHFTVSQTSWTREMSHGFQRSIKLSADATGRFMSEMTARRLSYVIQRKMNVHNYLHIMLLSI